MTKCARKRLKPDKTSYANYRNCWKMTKVIKSSKSNSENHRKTTKTIKPSDDNNYRKPTKLSITIDAN